MASKHTRFEPRVLGVAVRFTGWVTVAGLICAGSAAALRAQSDSGATTSPSPSPASHTSGTSKTPSKSDGDGRVTLNLKAASWNRVLKRIARHGGLDVVMKSSPPGTFSCSDTEEHTIPDALRIVNRQLEPRGFRALQQGKYLVVLNLDGLRSGYNSPSFVRNPRLESQGDGNSAQPTAAPTTPASASRSTADATQVSATAPEASAGPGVAPAVMELNADGNSTGSVSSPPASAASSANADHPAAESDRAAKDGDKKDGDKKDKDDDKKEPKDAQDLKIEKADTTPTIRIFYAAANWPAVLQSVSDQSGLTLVMKKCPSGNVKFRDWTKHTTSEIINYLNQELEADQSNFRLVREESFLIVVNKDDLRSEYERPVVGHLRRPVHSEVEMITEDRPASPVVQAPAPTVAPAVVPASANTLSDEAADAPGRVIEPVRLDAADAPELLPAPTSPEQSNPATLNSTPSNPIAPSTDSWHARRAAEIFAPPASESTTQQRPTGDASGSDYVPQHRRVEAIARRLYTTLKGRADLVDSGPENLPSFRIFDAHYSTREAGSKGRLACTIGIDTEHNRLVIDGSAPKRAAARRVFACLDGPEPAADEGLRLVSADVPRATIAKNVTTELNQIVAQNIQGPVAPAPEQAPGRATLQVAPNQPNLSELIKGLKGEVTVESVPELGIVILRGNPTDVDAVMKVIREVERLGAGAAPTITILPLQYVNSDSFATLLNKVYADLHGLRTSEAAATAKPLIKLYAIVKPNAVLVIAPPSELSAVRELTLQLDKPVIPETEFQVFQLKHGIAGAIAKSVNDFYKGRTGLGTVVEAVSDARTNSVIVQARPRDLEEVAKLITRLDGPTASQATVKIFSLTNGDATSIVRLLNQLFLPAGQQQGGAGAVQTAQGSEASPTTLRLTADVRTNSIIAVGAPETLQAIYAVILRLDNTDAHQRKTVVIKLKNNSSDAVQKAISDFVTAERSVAQIDPDVISTVELLEREVFIVSEPTSNSILLSATPRYFDELKKMIDKLDAAPTQVVIQAMLVQVTLTNDDEFGIELGFQSPVLFDRSTLSTPVTLTTTTSQNASTTVANTVNLSTSASPGFQFTDPTQGVDGLGQNSIVNSSTVGTQEMTNFGVGRTSQGGYGSGLVLAASSESVSFLLRALSYKESVHVLSRPMIRTVDNQLATVQVGKNVPIINGFIPVGTTGALAPIVRQDSAGIILTVTPRITPEGMVVMHAIVEKSEYETGASGGVILVTDPISGRTITSPIKDITHSETTVSLASGETVVMGGLITSSDNTTEVKAPWLGDIPILGQLFRYDTKTTIRTELLIFLTPRVIRSDADDETLKQIETERLHFMLDEAESIHGPILSTQPPVDGLMQQCPPLTMPQSGMVPPAPGVSPPIVPPATIPSGQQQALPPELPPIMSPAPGAAQPARPGVAPPPTPRETYLDDPSVPTTQMPAESPHDLRPLHTTTVTSQSFGPPFGTRVPAAEPAGAAQFPFQPSDAEASGAPAGK
jgi:type II secretion system protein D